MNPDSYAELPDDLQQTLDESLANVSAQIGQVWDALDAKGKAVLIEAGVCRHGMSVGGLVGRLGGGLAVATTAAASICLLFMMSVVVCDVIARAIDPWTGLTSAVS